MDDFKISYEGLLADDHRLDMRRFGYAIVGLDHLISAGVIALTEHRYTRPRERVDFTIVAKPPREGSVEVIGGLVSAYQALQASFPFVVEMIKAKCPDLVWHWLSFCFNHLGGRPADAEKHLDKLIEFMGKVHSETLQDRKHEREFLLKVLEGERQNAARVVMPLGNSSETLSIGGPETYELTEIDVPMAAAIRSKEDLRVSDISETSLRIDGITKHSNRASVELMEDLGRFYHAEIRDPLIREPDNQYFRALANNQTLTAITRFSFKGEDIHRVYILGLPPKSSALFRRR
jgi:hypothetical protein